MTWKEIKDRMENDIGVQDDTVVGYIDISNIVFRGIWGRDKPYSEVDIEDTI